jgi:NAD(P)-dependent dehydrogenase (short-subunit alcohol dehydrogenase family)
MATTRAISVVTGANRGIGLDVVRQLADHGHVVYLGSRQPDIGTAAAKPLLTAGLDVRPVEIDVIDRATLTALATRISEEHGRLDVLVNNAAIHYDTWQSAVDADIATVREAVETNVLGAWQTTQAVLPLLRQSSHARIVNVSSGAGSLTDMGGGTPAYRLTKASLNALTKMWAAELTKPPILVNSICPGWVATDMGGPGGRPVAEGAAGIVWAATLPDNGPTGGFFRDQHPIPW